MKPVNLEVARRDKAERLINGDKNKSTRAKSHRETVKHILNATEIEFAMLNQGQQKY